MQTNIDVLVNKRRINPFEDASILSKLTYWWLNDLLKLGLERPIESEDTYRTISSHQSKFLADTFSALWNSECINKTKPKLMKIFLQIYAKRVIGVSILYTILNITIRSFQPQCIGSFVYHLSCNDEGARSIRAAHIYGVSIIFCSVLLILINQPFNLYIVKLGMEIRLVCCSLIYRKILRLSKASVFDGFNGRVLNLMSTDVAVLDQSLQFIHSMWKGPLEMIVYGCLIHREIGVCGWLGVGFIATFFPLQIWIGKMAAKYRLQTTQWSDQRVKMMREILNGIQLIKMYTWEPAFCRIVGKIRQAELMGVRGTLLVKGMLMSFNVVSRMAIFLSLVSFVFFGNVFNARQVFIVTTYFNFLYDSMVFYWPLAIASWTESRVGLRRIEEFLLLPEKCEIESKSMQRNAYINYGLITDKKNDSLNSLLNASFKYEDRSDEHCIIFDNCSVALSDKKAAFGIKNIELKLKSNCAIIGDVGAGKSVLLKTILRDLPVESGRMTVSGSLSYASQEPWLFQDTVRRNIIFTEPFDAQRYARVVKACALESDFQQWPAGDQTIVGEQGASLSGGQRARVNLARAIYKQADIYLLDDPLAAVDAQVGKCIAEKCLREFLNGKMVVFVTHQLQYIEEFDEIIVMDNGRIFAHGDISQRSAHRTEETQKNDPHEAVAPDQQQENEENDDCQVMPAAEHLESQSKGTVKMSVYTGYLKSLGSVSIVMAAICMLGVEQFAVGMLDYYVSHWVNWENNLVKVEIASAYSLSSNASIDSTKSNTTGADVAIGHERASKIHIYCGIVAIVLYLVLQRLFGFVYLCSQASYRLHAGLMRGIMGTTMRFFRVNDSGRILNRFSKDMSIIDSSVPSAVYYTTSVRMFLLQSISTLVLISFGHASLILLVFVLTGIFFGLRHVYVSSARCMKRIEATARSPMFSHVNATIDGLSTIQVHRNALQPLCDEFDALQDDNVSAGFIFFALSRALSLWIELVSLLYMSVVIIVFLWLQNHSSSGNVGLAITQILFLGTMSQWGIKQTAELENHMTSVERVLEYTNLPSEIAEAKITPTDWPRNGAITLKSLSLRYSCDAEPMLRDLNIEIAARAKVAIVGRTGAGKSSIVQAIFRLAQIDGCAEIDGVDIMSVSLRQLRQSITIIAQEPILFSGTIRDNLDPLGEHSDDAVWDALDDVELKHVISRTKNGLNALMTNAGANFSLGQRQLLCLARAVLRQNKIVILDEATANVDGETDKIVQRMISKKFANSTVLTIAHRLHTIMDADKVLVMDAGRAVEYDSPSNLMQLNDGVFKSLIGHNIALGQGK